MTSNNWAILTIVPLPLFTQRGVFDALVVDATTAPLGAGRESAVARRITHDDSKLPNKTSESDMTPTSAILTRAPPLSATCEARSGTQPVNRVSHGDSHAVRRRLRRVCVVLLPAA
jgi:hypothetical protein